MKRLRDLEGGGPLLSRARDLLRAVEPPPEVTAQMPEFRRALTVEPLHPRRPPLVGRTVLVAGVALVAAGAAAQGGAWVWRSWHNPEPAPAVAPASPAATQSADSARPRAARTNRERPTVPEPASTAESAVPATDERPLHGATAGSHKPEFRQGVAPAAASPAAPSRAGAAPEASAPTAPSSAAEAALVHSAVKALRRDGDPGRAAKLLDRYAARDPHGPLAEEALSLRIEAALARQDPKACTYAREYLARHPGGRYRNVAQRALQGTVCR